jgi:predicted transposase YbfD/YdcC
LDARQATSAQLAEWIRGHWQIEVLHHLRAVSYSEDASQIRIGSGLQITSTLPESWPYLASSFLIF